jgi:dolichol kinase
MFSLGDIVGLILVYSYVALVIVIAVYAKRWFPGCGYRKIIHILIGNIVFIWWVFDSRYVMAFLAAAPFIPLLILMTPNSPLRKFDNSFLKMATAQGHGYGLVYYAISWTILALVMFDNRLIASIAIVAMSYGDGVGGLIGKQYGKKKLWKDKSYVGTMAVFCGTFIATLAVISFYTALSGSIPSLNVFDFGTARAVLTAAIVGAFVTIVELFSPGEYDNIIVPFSTAALVLTLEWFMGA